MHDSHGFATQAKHCVEPNALGWYAAGFILFIVILGGFIMPTVLVGVISVAFTQSHSKIAAELESQRRVKQVARIAQSWTTPSGLPVASERQMYVHLRAVFDSINFSDAADALEPSLDADELIPFLYYICKKYLTPVSERDLRRMFELVDTSGDGAVSWAEFLWFVLFLKKEMKAAHASNKLFEAANNDLGAEETKAADVETEESGSEMEMLEMTEGYDDSLETTGGYDDSADLDWDTKSTNSPRFGHQEHTRFCDALAKFGINGDALLAHFQQVSSERRAEYLATFASSPELFAKVACNAPHKSGAAHITSGNSYTPHAADSKHEAFSTEHSRPQADVLEEIPSTNPSKGDQSAPNIEVYLCGSPSDTTNYICAGARTDHPRL